jgi:hypothetical protein
MADESQVHVDKVGDTPAQEIAAHSAAQSHKYVMHFPAHPARKDDPHYADFNAYHRKHHDTATCYIGDRVGTEQCSDGPLELHHAHIEFSLQNGVDLAALEKDYPGISNPDEVGDWIESEQNFRWLCVLPGTPILMADGSTLPIEEVKPGQQVITHDGTAQTVRMASRKRYRGEVVRLGSALLTPTHRVLTDRGWLPAAHVLREVGVHGTDVIRLRGEQQQVLAGVVGPVPVDVMHALSGVQASANPLFHYDSVFHLEPAYAATVDLDADVSARVGVSAGAVFGGFTGQGGEPSKAALIGAELRGSRAPMRPTMELDAAYTTRKEMAWVAPVASRSALFSGWVHDLSIDHNHSFVAGGIAVHNCAFHHRGHAGAHTTAHADWEASQYIKGLFS